MSLTKTNGIPTGGTPLFFAMLTIPLSVVESNWLPLIYHVQGFSGSSRYISHRKWSKYWFIVVFAIKAYFNCMYRSHKGIFFVLLSSFSFTYNFWVTLPCAVQFLICAPTNGGKLKSNSVHFYVCHRIITSWRKIR